jgi:hypothetical protein
MPFCERRGVTIMGNSGLTLVFCIVVFSLNYVLNQVMKRKNIKTIQTLRWILILVFKARLPPFWELL